MAARDNFDLDNFDNLPNLPPINLLDNLNENNNDVRPTNHPSSAFRLHILCIFFLDLIVRLVEDTVGWPGISIDNLEEVPQMNPRNISELRSLIRCLKHLYLRKWTPDVQYVMLNLRGYKELLGSVVEDMKLFREQRSSRTWTTTLPTSSQCSELPVIDRNDLRRHAVGVQALLDDLERVQARDGDRALVLLDEYDQHIDTFEKLLQFLQ